MLRVERMRADSNAPIEYIWINPKKVTVIVPRRDTVCGACCDVSLSNATTFSIMGSASTIAEVIADRNRNNWPN